MLVLTSVIVTVAPGTARPASSRTFPRSPPLTACAVRRRGMTRTTASVTIAAKRRSIFILLRVTNKNHEATKARRKHLCCLLRVFASSRLKSSGRFTQQLLHPGHALPRRFFRRAALEPPVRLERQRALIAIVLQRLELTRPVDNPLSHRHPLALAI